MLLSALESWYEEENQRIDDYIAPNKEVIELSDSLESVRKSSSNPDASVMSVERYRVPKKKSLEKIQMHFATIKLDNKLWNDVAERGNKVQKKGKNILCISHDGISVQNFDRNSYM